MTRSVHTFCINRSSEGCGVVARLVASERWRAAGTAGQARLHSTTITRPVQNHARRERWTRALRIW